MAKSHVSQPVSEFSGSHQTSLKTHTLPAPKKTPPKNSQSNIVWRICLITTLLAVCAPM